MVAKGSNKREACSVFRATGKKGGFSSMGYVFQGSIMIDRRGKQGAQGARSKKSVGSITKGKITITDTEMGPT